VLASAPTTSGVRHIVIEGRGHAGRITNLHVPQLLSLSLYSGRNVCKGVAECEYRAVLSQGHVSLLRSPRDAG
jgi:hypothetical protein